VPPQFRYVSRRKRRAMRLALHAFAEDNPAAKVDWSGSWVWHVDSEKCFVFIQRADPLLPATHAGFVIWHALDKIDRLGGYQFHWGMHPKQVIEEYESRPSAPVEGNSEPVG